MSAGHIIRLAREAEGLTQVQLARRLGITQPSIARLEAAGDNVTIATLQRALNVMNRTLELHSALMPSSVDESQIREALRLTPGERIERHDTEYESVRQFANEVQPQVARARMATVPS
jgi:transcriptional regulator with XRE-family HTH domain